MIKNIILIISALLGFSQLSAQEYEYVPFVREGVKWVYWYNSDFTYSVLNMPGSLNYLTFEMKGDTVIAGKHFKPVRLSRMDYNKEEAGQDFTPVYLREENKVVYAIHPDRTRHAQCPVGIDFYVGDNFNQIRTPEGEYILYDFNDPIALYDSVFQQDNEMIEEMGGGKYIDYQGTDTIMVGNHHSKRHHYKSIYDAIERIEGSDSKIIEGIGYDGYAGFPLFYFEKFITGFQVAYGLSHVVEDGEIIYKSSSYTDDMYMPLDREGVQWVNERVTVNGSDTICHYYTYQTKGSYPNEPYTACYYHDSKGVQNGEPGTLVAGLGDLKGNVYSYRNTALEQVISEDRNMMNYGPQNFETKIIYEGLMDFSPSYGEVDYLPTSFFDAQREPLLSTENFFKVDPIMIENCLCSRWAYVDDQGKPVAYIVEGIGFDSYDLGDLLTPFTRKPDPNADHQERCGLSHVINKDGKIIYKGMRYREDGFHGINEVVTDMERRPMDENYYDLMGRSVGKQVPTMPGIYIHQGKKIIVR